MKILRIILCATLVIAFFNSCQKEYSIEAGNPVLSGTWQFQESTVQYNGNIDSAVIDNTGGAKHLKLEGKELAGQQTFSINLFTPDSFVVGSYRASLAQSEFDYFNLIETIFKADFLTGEFVVDITTLSNNLIEGTFAGQAIDSSGNPTQITHGKFSSNIDLSNNSGGGGGTPAVGTLGADAGICTPVTPEGTYTQGTSLSSLNTVQVQVNITTPGTYAITTNQVNGVSFSNAGAFADTGVQNVVLIGAGTPVDAGDHTFTVTFGSGNCVFPITFLPGTQIDADYFPTTANSNWAYGLEGGTDEDSLLVTALGTTFTIDGNVYTGLITDLIPPSGEPDTAFFRKSGNDYFEYIDPAGIFPFDESNPVEYIFLKDNVNAGTSFQSPDFTGTVDSVPATAYIKMTIIEKGVVATVGTSTFNNVIKVKYEYFISLFPAGAAATEERWFAPNVGLIYINIDNTNVFNIGRYSVL